MQTSEDATWQDVRQDPTGFPPLELKSAHVWRLEVSATLGWLRSADQMLNAEERIRADRFHFEQDRSRFALCRAALRLLLGRYLAADPGSIRFQYEEHGKPRLSDDNRRSSGSLEFNVSHSGDLALMAFGRSGPLGVDVERLRGEIEMQALAERFFSPQEVAELNALPPAERAVGFFNCWTRKEAYVKARGQGLSLGLDSFAVTLRPGVAPALAWSRQGSGETSSWRLWDLPTPAGYRASLASPAEVQALRLFSFAPDGRLS